MRANRIMALVTDAFGARGGIAQYNRDLLIALSNFWRVDVLPRHGEESNISLPPQIVQHPPRSGRIAYSISALSEMLRKGPRIIFCGHLYMAPLAAVLAFLCRSKLVVQMHGIESWERPTRLQRWGVSRADLILCVSRHTRACVNGWCDIAAERVIVLPNTVGNSFTPGDRAAARVKFGLKDEQILLSVGRLDARERYKGHEAAIDALAGLLADGRDIIYLIAGEGDDRPRLEALAKARNVEERVRFLGAVAKEILPDLYRAADVFVLPSSGEGFGIVFIEAMACGTTVLGYGVAGAKDALADGQLGLVAPLDALGTAMAHALDRARQANPVELERAARGRFDQRHFAARAARLIHVFAG
jgi:phosphatidyl-myo-inositol dimannoside synthase